MRALYKILSAACLSLMLVACSGGSPENVAKAFVEKSYKGDTEAVLKMVHLPDEDKAEPGVKELVEGKVKASVAKAKAKADAQGGVDSITAQPFEPADNEGKRGRVKVEVRFNKDKEKVRQDSVKLIKTDDGWKVDFR